MKKKIKKFNSYLENAVEFSGEAYRVSMQLLPGLEFALIMSHKRLPAIEKVCKKVKQKMSHTDIQRDPLMIKKKKPNPNQNAF